MEEKTIIISSFFHLISLIEQSTKHDTLPRLHFFTLF